MATRKIRLTLSGTQLDGVGPFVDIDFNGENLEVDVDVDAVTGTNTLVKEYTVDVAPGTYNLDITFKNDAGGDVDRNLNIEKIEISNDGVEYNQFLTNESNSNLTAFLNFSPMEWRKIPNPDYDNTQPKSDSNLPHLLNPEYDSSQARTDDELLGWHPSSHPGSNAKWQWQDPNTNITIYKINTATFYITFA